MKVLISTSSFCEYSNHPIDLLSKKKWEIIKNPYGRKMNHHEIIDLAQDVNYIIAGTETYDKKLLNKLTNLKIISRVGVGLDNIDIDFANKKGVLIHNTALAPSIAVAEFTVSLILNSLKKINESSLDAKKGLWNKKSGTLLSKKTIGIVGAGNIGKKVMNLMANFKNNYLVFDEYQDKQLSNKKNISYVSLEDVFKKSDVISLHLPLSKKTKNLVNKKLLNLMKKDALLVNTSRGEIINEQDLFNFLKKNKNIQASLDVFKNEPYEGPLLELPNVFITPHISAYAKETRAEMEIEAVKNLIKSV